jgi:phosphoglycolate phosphatase
MTLCIKLRADAMHAVFLDLDGTLADSRDDLATAVNLTRRDYGLASLPPAAVAGFVGEGMRRLVERALPERPAEVDAALARARGHYRAHLLDRTALYPGVAEGLRRLTEQGWRCAVVTSKLREFVDPLLAGLGIANRFGAVVGGGETAVLKPDPEPLRLAAGRLGLPALAGSWMAGDHFTDLAAGRRAGMRCCYCRYGFGDPRGEPFDLAVDSLVELAAHLGAAPR